MKVVDKVKKQTSMKSVNWLWQTKDWANERIVVGPLTSKSVDSQREKVLLSKDRLKFIYNYGKLIYNHHSNPNDPVIILGDCLGIGTDSMGKTFAIWGVAEGSETIDEAWEEMKKYGEGAGFSIGGKRTEIECNGDYCTLNDPEITEVSWTPRPANQDCKVYYINQLAKSILHKAEESGDTFELKTQMKRMEKKLGNRFEVDPYYDVNEIQEIYPCTKEYVMGMMEQGLKKSEANDMLDDFLTKIQKKVHNMEQEQTIEKVGEVPAQNPAQTGGNAVLEMLGQIVNALTELNVKIDGLSSMSAPTGQEEPPMEKPEPPMDEPEEEPSEEVSEEEESDDEPEEKEGKKKEVEKSENDLNLPEGEKPEPEGPQPEDTTSDEASVPEKEELDMPEGSSEEEEGPNQEIELEVSDKGDASDEGTPLDLPEGENPEEEGPNPKDVELTKGIVKKPLAKEDVFELLKKNNYTVVTSESRSKVTPDDPMAMPSQEPEKISKKKKSTLEALKDGVFNLNKS